MSMKKTRVDFGKRFDKELDRLDRKYPKVTDELGILVEQLKANERPGDKIPNVGYDVYKVRLANPSAGRGKRGGFRVVYYVRLADHVILLTIYSKTQQEDIPTQAIQDLISDVLKTQENDAND